MKYEIFKSSSGLFAIKLEEWGFLNRGWSGVTQSRTEDPNDAFVVRFDTEERARYYADAAIKDFINDTWEKI